ncbi:MAG: serine/threonine-protein kinase [Acidobacteriota bacterium]
MADNARNRTAQGEDAKQVDELWRAQDLRGLTGSLLANRYLLGEPRSEWPLGAVLFCHDRQNNEPLIAKILLHQRATTQLILRFQDEAERLCRACQDFTTVYHDAGVVADQYSFVIVREPVQKVLSTFVRKGTLLSVGQCLAIGMTVAARLERAHQVGVLHTNLSPDKIWFEFGERGEVDNALQITGFGMLDTAPCDYRQMSPYYASPEQLLGRQLDSRSDIYSLGVILYELFTGRLPFEGETPADVVKKHLTRQPIPLRVKRKEIAEDIERIIACALSKDYRHRYESAADMVTILAQVRERYERCPTTELTWPPNWFTETQDSSQLIIDVTAQEPDDLPANVTATTSISEPYVYESVYEDDEEELSQSAFGETLVQATISFKQGIVSLVSDKKEWLARSLAQTCKYLYREFNTLLLDTKSIWKALNDRGSVAMAMIIKLRVRLRETIAEELVNLWQPAVLGILIAITIVASSFYYLKWQNGLHEPVDLLLTASTVAVDQPVAVPIAPELPVTDSTSVTATKEVLADAHQSVEAPPAERKIIIGSSLPEDISKEWVDTLPSSIPKLNDIVRQEDLNSSINSTVKLWMQGASLDMPLASTRQITDTEAEMVMQLATKKFNLGEYRQAVELLKPFAERANGNAKLHMMLGQAYMLGHLGSTRAFQHIRAAVRIGATAHFKLFHMHNGLDTGYCDGDLSISTGAIIFQSKQHTLPIQRGTLGTLDNNFLILDNEHFSARNELEWSVIIPLIKLP